MIDYEHPSIKGLKEDIRKYSQHRRQAAQRGIDFLLSFAEWYEWWQQTGHYEERGCRHGQYVMARHNDTGPYSLDNIKCITHEENRSECYANPAFRISMLKENRNKPKAERESIQAPTGLPEKAKKEPQPSARSLMTEEERAAARSEAAKRTYQTRLARGNAIGRPGPKKNKENYKGRTPWNKGMKTGPRPPEVIEAVRQGVLASYERKRESQ